MNKARLSEGLSKRRPRAVFSLHGHLGLQTEANFQPAPLLCRPSF